MNETIKEYLNRGWSLTKYTTLFTEDDTHDAIYVLTPPAVSLPSFCEDMTLWIDKKETSLDQEILNAWCTLHENKLIILNENGDII